MPSAAETAAARWLDDTIRHGLTCFMVESRRNLGQRGEFEEACLKTRLQLSSRNLSLASTGISVQLKELKAIETHRRRPGSPVFRVARDDVPPRLATIRWNQTGRATQAGQHVHLLFPTRSDAVAFQRVMADVQRFGVGGVLRGRSGQEEASWSEPTEWQIERAKECFTAAMKSKVHLRLMRILLPCIEDAVDDLDEAQRVGEGDEAEAPPPPLRRGAVPSRFPVLREDEDMHLRWAEALGASSDAMGGSTGGGSSGSGDAPSRSDGAGRGRRAASELSPEELQPLVDAGMPLRYRHMLWSKWIGGVREGAVIEEMHSQSLDDVAKQIELDIPRTHPAWLCESQQAMLRRVLNAYSVHNPSVGYCQGMNFLAMVFILLGFGEELVFAGVSHVVEEVLPGCHNLGLEGYIRDAAVLDILVHHRLPAVRMQMEAMDVQMVVLALDHFVSLMAGKWPFEAVVRLWDLVLAEGSSAVFASFLALLELYFPLPAPAAEGGAGAEGAGAEEAVDAMGTFRSAALRGAEEEMDKILARSRRWLSVLPPCLIEKLRSDILEDDSSH